MQPVTRQTARLELSIPTDGDAEDFVSKARTWWDEQTELTWGIRADATWVGMIGGPMLPD